MKVTFKEKIIRLSKDSTFLTFKHEILKKDGSLIKNFFYGNKLISECSPIKNFEKFKCEMEPYEYAMSKSGRYRCKFCHQYLKTNKWVCGHTNKCKSQYSFKIKIYNLYENAEVSFVDKEDNEKKSDDDDEEIDKIVNKVVETKKKKNEVNAENMRNKYLPIINSILNSE